MSGSNQFLGSIVHKNNMAKLVGAVVSVALVLFGVVFMIGRDDVVVVVVVLTSW